MFKKVYLLLVCFAFNGISFAQNTDSLRLAFKNAKHDTTRVQILVELVNILAGAHPDSIIPISNQIVSIVEKNPSPANSKIKSNLKIYEAIAYGNIGYSNSQKGNIPIALDYYHKSLKIQEENKDEQGVASTLSNIGAIFSKQGNIPKALEYYLRALKIQEKIQLKSPDNYYANKDLSTTLNNLAGIYKQQGEPQVALSYYERCLKIDEKSNNKKGMAVVLGNIAGIYKDKGDLGKALELYNKGLKIETAIKNRSGIAYSLSFIATIYKTMSEKPEYQSLKGSDTLLTKAKEYYLKSLKIREEIKDKQGTIFSLSNVAGVYLKLDSLQLALDYGNRGLALAKQLGFPDPIRYSAIQLKKIYQQLNKPTEALQMLELAVLMKDSVSNEANKKSSLKKQFQYEYEKKEMLLNAEQEKKDLIHAIQKEKDLLVFKQKEEQQKLKSEQEKKELGYIENLKLIKLKSYYNINKANEHLAVEKKEMAHKAQSKQLLFIIISVVICLSIVIVFSIFLYRRFRITDRQKVIISIQKAEVEKQRELADERNKEIIDSITYAEKILRAMLPSDGYINNELNVIDAKSFILFKPKDIVSGDFYWFYKNEDALFYATADSTGHGVPGGFMSMLGINLLNEIVIERKITDPGQILNKLREEIVKSLKTDDGYTKDGMDVVLCKIVINDDKRVLEYASANNSFYIIRNNEIMVHKAQKMPVGYMDNMADFETRQISIEKNDTIYSFTDGYADQFGGPKGKKFKYKPMETLMLSMVNEPMEVQKQKLNDEFENWRMDLEQVDDVCIIGIRI